MGLHLPPSAIMPEKWANKTTLKEIPTEPGVESYTGYWIEELSAWCTADADEEEIIRELLPTAKIIRVENLSL